ncbi:hypothetical protein BGX28_005341 [Mortierella sp. GBA30]|nr:hypothetical protein BGX28_005341 [Mortierella sp. GBA30]
MSPSTASLIFRPSTTKILFRYGRYQASYARAMHTDNEATYKAAKKFSEIAVQIQIDAKQVKSRQYIFRAMEICKLGVPTDRALFWSLVEKHDRVLQEAELDRLGGVSRLVKSSKVQGSKDPEPAQIVDCADPTVKK